MRPGLISVISVGFAWSALGEADINPVAGRCLLNHETGKGLPREALEWPEGLMP